MPLYEHTVIARPDLSAQQAQALADQFGQVVADQGGKVAKVEYWGLRNLSYRVKKNRKGHYIHLNVDAPAAAITELERTQRIHEDVLRYLTVKVEAFEEGPSAVMQAKSSRDERGGRRDFERGGRDRDRDRGERGDRGDRGERGERGDRGERDRGEFRS
jgi:small subunit ribosomal protein S6